MNKCFHRECFYSGLLVLREFCWIFSKCSFSTTHNGRESSPIHLLSAESLAISHWALSTKASSCIVVCFLYLVLVVRSRITPTLSGALQVCFFFLCQSFIVHLHLHKKASAAKLGCCEGIQQNQGPAKCCWCCCIIHLQWLYSPKMVNVTQLSNVFLWWATFLMGLQYFFLLREIITRNRVAASQGRNCRPVEMTLLPSAVEQPGIVMSPPVVPASTNASKSLQLPNSAWKQTLCPELMQGQMQNRLLQLTKYMIASKKFYQATNILI